MGGPAMRARHAANATLAALAALALTACEKPDVGDPCQLDVYVGGTPIDVPLTNPEPGYACSTDEYDADYFRSGAPECENLICIRSATGASCRDPALVGYPYEIRKYCSKACVSDRECFSGETGLFCRQIVLDPVFLANLPPDVRERYLGVIQSSSYCATP